MVLLLRIVYKKSHPYRDWIETYCFNSVVETKGIKKGQWKGIERRWRIFDFLRKRNQIEFYHKFRYKISRKSNSVTTHEGKHVRVTCTIIWWQTKREQSNAFGIYYYKIFILIHTSNKLTFRVILIHISNKPMFGPFVTDLFTPVVKVWPPQFQSEISVSVFVKSF